MSDLHAATEREKFEAFMRGPVPDGTDPALWVLWNADEVAWQAWQARAALSAPAVPPGFVLVPVEPTPEMVSAYLDRNDTYWHDCDALPPPPGTWRTGTPSEATAASYRAMLAAAPSAKEPQT